MRHLTREQRYTISILKSLNKTQKEISEAIGVHKSTISRELHRNRDKRSGEYRYDLAERKYRARLKEKPKSRRVSEELLAYVKELVREDYSPEQIYGRSKADNKDCISHETIYQIIWKDKREGGTLYKHLRRQGRRYRKRGASKDSRGLIKNRVSIEERPVIVDEKIRIGDFEIDTMVGRNHKSFLLTINDRVTSKVWIRKLESKNANDLAETTITALTPFKEIIHTITADNGKEFADHERIAASLEIGFYFAHPYHSWERGANENTNGLIRQYFPKGMDFRTIDDQYIKEVETKLNARPRKKLRYKTPDEIFFSNIVNLKVAFVT